MEFGLFYEIPAPEPWFDGQEHQLVKRAVDEARLADELGWHSFWTVEHHFLKSTSLCSAPEVLYGHIAAVTERMRIGHSVRLVPHPYNNPIRVAEQAATVDLLSDGRLEFGIGRSGTWEELGGFGIDPADTRPMATEALDAIVRAWTEDEMDFDGTYWKMPRRRVSPKPLQQPHPPIWQATVSPEGHTLTGEMGVGLLSFTLGVGPESLKERIDSYREGLTRARPVGRFVNDRAGAFTMVCCGPTREAAKEAAEDSILWYGRRAQQFATEAREWMEQRSSDLGTYSYYAAPTGETTLPGAGGEMTYDQLDEIGAIVVGDPDRVIEVARDYEAAGCQLLLCLLNPMDVAHEDVVRSIRLIGEHVIPEFSS